MAARLRLGVAAVLPEVPCDEGLDRGAVVGVEVAPGDEVVGQRPGLVAGPGLEGGDELALVDQAVLQREQAEEEVARGIESGGMMVGSERGIAARPGSKPRKGGTRLRFYRRADRIALESSPENSALRWAGAAKVSVSAGFHRSYAVGGSEYRLRPADREPYDGPMSHPKCRDTDYIDFLIATPRAASCCEAARSQPPAHDPPAHDAYTRLLHRLEPDPETLYREVEPLVDKADGVLVLDDSTLDKLYAKAIEPVHRHWSGKHKSVVRGINLISLVWTDGDRTMPLDYRVYDKPKDGLTKNDHFLAMLDAAKRRGFRPHAVLFDSWYSGLENLKRVRDHGWTFLTQLKVNRLVDLDRRGYRAVGVLPIDAGGDGRPSEGVRADPGIQGGLPRRGR